jgi:hypothetical protein
MTNRDREKQLKELLDMSCCPFGACRRVRGHAGQHDDAFSRSAPDTAVTGEHGDKPTEVAIEYLKELLEELDKDLGVFSIPGWVQIRGQSGLIRSTATGRIANLRDGFCPLHNLRPCYEPTCRFRVKE